MKKFLITLTVLFLIVVTGIAILIATFNPNRYKDDVARTLSQAIGSPVSIGSISLAFHNGLALQLNHFELGQEDNLSHVVSLTVERFFLHVELAPLLRREIRVRECVIESPVFLIKPAASRPPAPSQAAIPTQSSAGPAGSQRPVLPADIAISAIKIVNGTLSLADETAPISLRAITLELEDVSATNPILFSGHAEIELGSVRRLETDGTFSYQDGAVQGRLTLDRTVSILAKATNVFGLPFIQADVKVERLDLASFLTEHQKEREYFSGFLTVAASFTAQARDLETIKQTVTGKGTAHLDSGALKNRNVLRENLERISQIPAIGTLFQLNLGPRFDALLKSPDTTFDTADVNFQIANRRVSIERLELDHADYAVSLRGFYQLDGPIDLSGALLVRNPLSEAMIKKVKELVYLAAPEGHISIPFTCRGAFPGISIQPNVGNLVKQTVNNLGTELLQEGLTKLLEKGLPQSKTSAPPAQ